MDDMMRFDWDPDKAAKNLEKHGVSFEEAKTVFYDDRAVMFDDPNHSQDEDRFLILGISQNLRLLIVSHCLREEGEIIRIISAKESNNKRGKAI